MNNELFNTSLVLLLLTVLIWLVLRPVVLWYFKISERADLLREIRDAVQSSQSLQPQWMPEPQGAAPSAAQPIQRRPGESEDQFNSRMADELQRGR